MTKVQCVNCANFSFKRDGKASPMAAQGCGYCAFNYKPGEYLTSRYLRDCASFKMAADDVIQKRLDYLDGVKNGKKPDFYGS